MTPIDVAHAALMEAGRPDLAEIIVWIDEDEWSHIEVTDLICGEPEWELIDRAENIARAFIGMAPIERYKP